ncbi:MAG: hypothetical protein E7Z72_00605 [Methanocorpusculum parvum]|nr:hypothetical protein [Methanocorpusculum parvum]
MTNQQEIADLLPIVSPYSLPDGAAGASLIASAEERTLADAPGLGDNQQTLACAYYIAHIMAVQSGKSGITSRHLGSWSESYTHSETTAFLEEYTRIVKRHARTAGIKASQLIHHADIAIADTLGMDDSDAGIRLHKETS